MNPAEMFQQGRKLLCVPVGLGEKHVVAAPFQHLGRNRLTIRVHFNLRCLLLPALIGWLIDLSHAYITTVSAGFVPSAAHLRCVRRATDKQNHLCRLTAVQCSIRWT